jgi:hypothetical protein
VAPLGKRRPPRIDYPDAMPCAQCDERTLRHCKGYTEPNGKVHFAKKACNWYDCNACHVRTYIVGPPSSRDGRRYWQCLSLALWW